MCNLVACKAKDYKDVNINFVISDLSDQDYQNINATYGTKDNFKKISFVFDIKHGNKITNRVINIPDLKKIINSYDTQERYWTGDSSNTDNANDNFAYYETNLILYTKGLSTEDIKNIFKSAEVSLSYLDKKNNHIEDIFKISDVIQSK